VPVYYGGPAGGGSASWVRQWYMDPQNDGTAVDIKGGSTYTDDSGETWSTGGGEVTGDSNASVLGVIANTALRVTTSASSGNVVVARPIVDVIPDYAITDRMLMVLEFTSAPTLPNTNDRCALMWRDTADNYRHRIANDNTSGGNVRAQRRNNGSNVESNRLNNTEEVLAIEWWNLSSRLYYASAFPSSDPLTDDLTYTCDSSFSITPQQAVPHAAATDEFGFLVRRNGAADFTIDIAHWALYRWEAVAT